MMQPMNYIIKKLQTIEKKEQLEGLIFDFKQCNHLAPPLPTLNYLNIWYKYYSNRNIIINSIAYYKKNVPVCLILFYLEKNRNFPYINTLKLVGQGEPEHKEVALEYLDFHIKSGYEETIYPLIINEINKLDFDLFTVKSIFADSHIAKIMPHITGNLVKQHYAQYMITNAHWQLAQLSKNTRSRINRCKNQLAKLGATSRWLTPNEYEDTWCLLKSYHQSRWQRKGKTGAFSSPEFNSFHQALREQKISNVAMSAVFIGGQPIAIHYYLVSDDTYHFYQSGWDEQNFAKLSPGLFLHYWSITHCPKKHYDFMMGGLYHSYKAKFNADARAMLSITLVKNPIKLFISKIINKLTRTFS